MNRVLPTTVAPVLLLACASATVPAQTGRIDMKTWTASGARLDLPADWDVSQDAAGLRASPSVDTPRRCPAPTVVVTVVDGGGGADETVAEGMGCRTHRTARHIGLTRLVCEEHAEGEPLADGVCAAIVASFREVEGAGAAQPPAPVADPPAANEAEDGHGSGGHHGVVDLSDPAAPTFRPCDADASVPLKASAALVQILIGHTGRPETSPRAHLPVLLAGTRDAGGALVATDWLASDLACTRTIPDARWMASGTEPFWALEMGDTGAVWRAPPGFAPEGRAVVELVGDGVPDDPPAGAVAWTDPDGEVWTVQVREEDCDDGMGPGLYPYRVEVAAPWRTHSGCAYRTR
jgi:uncharacterized membrane protein